MKKRFLAAFLSICVMAGAIAYPAESTVVMAAENEEEIWEKDKIEGADEIQETEGEIPVVEEQEISSVGTTSGDWTYEEWEDGVVEITGYSGNDTEVTIPETIDGKSVTGIGAWTFYNCSGLTSINIPDSVTSIGNYAFYNCRRLTSIYIPNSVTSIGEGAFDGCSGLTSIDIPNDVTSIGDWTFSYCSGLTNIDIPNSVTSIGNYAFYGCNGLTSIDIPNSVTSIGEWAFSNCSGLASINVSKGNTRYAAQDGILYNREMTEILCCPEGITGSISISGSITSIGNYAFYDCSGLTSIEIPVSVMSIGERAFSGCSGLISIEIPDSVMSIEEGTFYGCSRLTSIEIPASVMSIGKFVFYECSGLTSIEIPNSVKSIEEGTFYGCSRLTSVEIPDSVMSIGFGAFANSGLTSIKIPAGVTGIGYSAFDDCNNLTIYCYKNSAAHTYAVENGIPYEFLDDAAKQAHTHTYTTITVKATPNKNGSITKKCTVCGSVASKTTIYYPKTITLSRTSYTYNGKVQKPSVTVKDSKGKKLKKGMDYTVSYSGGCKNVGKYTVTIKFKGNYSGTVKKTFTITPKSTSLSKLTAKKKGFTAKWKKLTSQTTGYEIQYSTSSKFTKKTTKTATVSKNKTTSKSISKLKAKKKYYVRIRTYKTVKVNGKSTKIYSSWSKAKTVTTKK